MVYTLSTDCILSSRQVIQLTFDDWNLQGKSKKVRVIGSSKQVTGNEEIRN